MTKKLAIILLCAAAVCGAVWFLAVDSRPADPVWQGKTLSHWLKECRWVDPGDGSIGGPGDPPKDAQAAIRAMGTNAIPYLLMMAKETDSDLKVQLRTRLNISFLKRLIPLHNEDRIRAAAGFKALGEAGAPAVPELTTLLETDDMNSHAAVIALGWIGPPAIPALRRALTNLSIRVRVGAANSLGVMGAEAAIPDLLRCLDDPEPEVRGNAMIALSDMRKQPDLVITKLMGRLGDTNEVVREVAAMVIGGFGSQARMAVPKLTELQNDPNADVRQCASNALIEVQAVSTNQDPHLPSPLP